MANIMEPSPRVALTPVTSQLAEAEGSFGNNPLEWSRLEVYAFLRWCTKEYDLPPLDLRRFHMNGKALCLLSKSDFNQRAPDYGFVIHHVVHKLQMDSTSMTDSAAIPAPMATQDEKNKPSALIIGGAQDLPGVRALETGLPDVTAAAAAAGTSVSGESIASSLSLTATSAPTPLSQQRPRPPIFFNMPTSNNNNAEARPVFLLPFLRKLLNDPRYQSFISWTNAGTGIFKINDPPGLARLWGFQKNNVNMDYEKMSRALRNFYGRNILEKVQEHHTYQFIQIQNNGQELEDAEEEVGKSFITELTCTEQIENSSSLPLVVELVEDEDAEEPEQVVEADLAEDDSKDLDEYIFIAGDETRLQV